jgi:hypothetical protein
VVVVTVVVVPVAVAVVIAVAVVVATAVAGGAWCVGVGLLVFSVRAWSLACVAPPPDMLIWSC